MQQKQNGPPDPLEWLKIPFRTVATNVQTGEETVFATGNTGRAVRASCSIPGVFQPVRIGDKAYVDGGVVSPVAVEAARRAGADVVIAVDISAGVAGTLPRGSWKRFSSQAISCTRKSQRGDPRGREGRYPGSAPDPADPR